MSLFSVANAFFVCAIAALVWEPGAEAQRGDCGAVLSRNRDAATSTIIDDTKDLSEFVIQKDKLLRSSPLPVPPIEPGSEAAILLRKSFASGQAMVAVGACASQLSQELRVISEEQRNDFDIIRAWRRRITYQNWEQLPVSKRYIEEIRKPIDEIHENALNYDDPLKQGENARSRLTSLCNDANYGPSLLVEKMKSYFTPGHDTHRYGSLITEFFKEEMHRYKWYFFQEFTILISADAHLLVNALGVCTKVKIENGAMSEATAEEIRQQVFVTLFDIFNIIRPVFASYGHLG